MEIEAIRRAFPAHFIQKKLPLQYEILLAIKSYPVLGKMSWNNIKDKFQHLLKTDEVQRR